MKSAALGLTVLFFGTFMPPAVLPAPLTGHARWASDRPVNSSLAVSGTVRLLAPPAPRPLRLPVYKSRSFCGSSVRNETLLTSAEGGVRNAVVLLHSLDRLPAVQPARIVLDNIKCAFAPHVQVAGIGSELLLKNSDPILHTVHARQGEQTLFNVGLPKGREVTQILKTAGVVRINCDVLHTWMTAAVVVASTPHYAMTDERGAFFIDDLPSGHYRMEVWHEILGTLAESVAVRDGGARSLDVVFSSAAMRAP